VLFLAPMSDEDCIPIGVSQTDLAAGHVLRMTNWTDCDSRSFEFSAKCWKIRRIEVEKKSVMMMRMRLLGKNEHKCTPFTVHSCPADGSITLFDINDLESKKAVEIERSLDV